VVKLPEHHIGAKTDSHECGPRDPEERPPPAGELEGVAPMRMRSHEQGGASPERVRQNEPEADEQPATASREHTESYGRDGDRDGEIARQRGVEALP